jgi:hypothetical protein
MRPGSRRVSVAVLHKDRVPFCEEHEIAIVTILKYNGNDNVS